MQVIVIDWNSSGANPYSIGEREVQIGSTFTFPAGVSNKTAEVAEIITDPKSKRTVAIAFVTTTAAKP